MERFFMTTRARASTKRGAVDAEGEETARPSTRRRMVVQAESDDDSSVEMLDALPPKTNVAMVERLLDEAKAGKVIACIGELKLSNKTEIKNEFKGTDICTNLVHVLNATESRGMKAKVCRLMICFTNSEQYFKRSFVSADAPMAIAKAMKQFPKKKLLLKRGCEALSNLASSKDKNDVKALVDAGCIELVAAAMKQYPASSQLQRRAMRCLAKITGFKTIPATKIAANVDLVIAAMNTHAKVELIQRSGLNILLKLSASNDQTKQDVMKKGGGVVAASAERKYRGVNEVIQKKALQLLKRLYS